MNLNPEKNTAKEGPNGWTIVCCEPLLWLSFFFLRRHRNGYCTLVSLIWAPWNLSVKK
jgi:hypothetical protein